MANLLEFRNVTKTYTRGYFAEAGTTALADFSMTLKEDEPTIMTVAGESGSGKTTLAMLLLGFIDPTKGEILYKGKNISKLRGDDRLNYRREVQAVFQDPFAVFNPFYTVDHLLTVPIEKFKLAKSKADARNKMEEALSSVGLQPGAPTSKIAVYTLHHPCTALLKRRWHRACCTTTTRYCRPHS